MLPGAWRRVRVHTLSSIMTGFLIETLALQALVYQVQNKRSRAEACLGQAIDLAHPRGLIRLFVDLGPEMSRLLNRLKLDEEALRYVGKIQAAFRGDAAKSGKPSPPDTLAAQGLLDPLTKRELEILGLLAQRLNNKEIGEKLFISPGTVKPTPRISTAS